MQVHVQGNTWVGDTPVVDGQVYEWGNTWSGGTQALSVSSKQHSTVLTTLWHSTDDLRGGLQSAYISIKLP